jgi:hypothetical protein
MLSGAQKVPKESTITRAVSNSLGSTTLSTSYFNPYIHSLLSPLSHGLWGKRPAICRQICPWPWETEVCKGAKVEKWWRNHTWTNIQRIANLPWATAGHWYIKKICQMVFLNTLELLPENRYPLERFAWALSPVLRIRIQSDPDLFAGSGNFITKSGSGSGSSSGSFF